MTAPRVSILIPAYRAGAFLGRTLRSVGGQTVDDYRVIVSIDDADAQTVAAAEDFAADPRLTIIRQSRRLGFVGNINFLLDRVDTPYCCILPHDDEIAPRYLEALLRVARARPEAAVVFTDVRFHFGAHRTIVCMRPLDGPPCDRIVGYFGSHDLGLPMRGLVPKALLDGGLRMPADLPEGRAADLVYVLRLLIAGPGIRVAEPLYEKHILPQSTSLGWVIRSEEDRGWRMSTWTPAVATSLAEIMKTGMSPPQRLACAAAAIGHFMARRADSPGSGVHGDLDGDMVQFVALLSTHLLSGSSVTPEAAQALLASRGFAVGRSRLLTARAVEARASGWENVAEDLRALSLTADPDNPLIPFLLPQPPPEPPVRRRGGRVARWLGRKQVPDRPG